MRRAVLILLFSLLATAEHAFAGSFTVDPTQVFLSGRTTTALLTLRNDSSEPLRFQLSAFAWQQTASGELALTPTEDVVFFTALLTLAPKEERRIRVGSLTKPAAREQTYRIFVEELPAPAARAGAAGVRVLTRMGIPVFIRPAKETASAELRDLAFRQGAFRFIVGNGGTVHFVPQKVTVRGIAPGGEQVFERTLPAWYILAGGRREFELAVPTEDCARSAAIAVDLEFASTVLRERLNLTRGACGT